MNKTSIKFGSVFMSVFLSFIAFFMTLGYAEENTEKDNTPSIINIVRLAKLEKQFGEIKEMSETISEDNKGTITTTFDSPGLVSYKATLENLGKEELVLSSIDLFDKSNQKEPGCISANIENMKVGDKISGEKKHEVVITIKSTCEIESSKTIEFSFVFHPVLDESTIDKNVISKSLETSTQSDIATNSETDVGSNSRVSSFYDELDELSSMIETLQNKLTSLDGSINKKYPVGSIYITTQSGNPSSIFGGSWSQISGRTLVGVDPANTNYSTSKKTGGTGKIKLSEMMIPSHTHTVSGTTSTKNFTGTILNMASQEAGLAMNTTGVFTATLSGSNGGYGTAKDSWIDTVVMNASHSHKLDGGTSGGTLCGHSEIEILNPYITVYIWERTS